MSTGMSRRAGDQQAQLCESHDSRRARWLVLLLFAPAVNSLKERLVAAQAD
jgi:hypothetical protein